MSRHRIAPYVCRLVGALVAAALVLPPGPALAGAPSFEDPVFIPYPTLTAGDLGVGDLDGDGHLDIAAADASGGGIVTLLRGMGDGLFDLMGTLEVPGRAGEISLGDLDGDADLELVVTASDPATILRGVLATFLGEGDGTFAPSMVREVFPAPNDALIRDLDADGQPDLALTKWTVPDVNLLPGRGDGTFGDERIIHLGAGAFGRRLASGHLNRDKQLDLIVTNHGLGGFSFSSDVTVLLNRGHGASWQSLITPEAGTVTAAGVDDLDADGEQDLAALVCRDAGLTTVCRIIVHLGAPNGTLGAGLVARTGLVADDLLLGDFDGDGPADAAVSGGGGIFVHPGRGDGTFDPPVVIDLHIKTLRLLQGDFNEDGRPDLAVAVYGGGLQVLLSRPYPLL